MKRGISILLTVLCLLSLSATASAEHLEGKTNWAVSFDGSTMSSNFHNNEYSDTMKGLQPGDDLTLTVTLKNDVSQRADWYMSNEVLNSLENTKNTSASGGAYTYTLTYIGPTQTRELYNSDTVGGEGESKAGIGLKEATNALKDYFYLDTLEPGKTAQIVLTVALEGESQGNRYQDTLGDLRMNFAAEIQGERRAVKTGDETNLMPLYVVALLSGVGVLILGIRDLHVRKKESERSAET